MREAVTCYAVDSMEKAGRGFFERGTNNRRKGGAVGSGRNDAVEGLNRKALAKGPKSENKT